MRKHIGEAEKRIGERMRAHEKAQKEKANSAA
jgi:hypothetical protein